MRDPKMSGTPARSNRLVISSRSVARVVGSIGFRPIEGVCSGRDRRPSVVALEYPHHNGLFPSAALSDPVFDDRVGGAARVVEPAVMDPRRAPPELSTADQDRSSVSVAHLGIAV